MLANMQENEQTGTPEPDQQAAQITRVSLLGRIVRRTRERRGRKRTCAGGVRNFVSFRDSGHESNLESRVNNRRTLSRPSKRDASRGAAGASIAAI